MQVTHIFHSGFFVETAQADFLFDWWKGTLPARADQRKPFYVFVSHSHGDHYIRTSSVWTQMPISSPGT